MSTLKEEAEEIKKAMEVECPVCGVVFEKKRPWQKVCSTKCRQEAYWRVHKVVKEEAAAVTSEARIASASASASASEGVTALQAVT